MGVMLTTLTSQRIYVVITETLRSYKRQEFLYRTGKSRTLRSYHLSTQEDEQDTDEARAFDVAVVQEYSGAAVRKLQWNASDIRWTHIGEAGEAAGLIWGGRWKNFPDLCHFQDEEE